MAANPPEVDIYLRQHPELVAALDLAQQCLRTKLGEPIETTLSIYRDPEIHDSYLTLIVRVPRYTPLTMRAIDEATAAIENMLVASGGWLIVTTDFVTLAGPGSHLEGT